MSDAVVTVATRSHLGTARALFGTPPMRGDGFDRYVCVADGPPGPAEVPAGVDVLRPDQFGIPDLHRFLFQYTPLELVCALKPYILRHLLAAGYRRVLYIDSDIYVVGSLNPVFDLLESAATLLTPHLTESLPDDGMSPDVRAIMRLGVFNGGFVGVSNSDPARRFVDWWCERTYRDCIDCPEEQVYVDQRWLDLVPGLFDDVLITRDPGVNVAYWNLHGRSLARTGGSWTANGRPLVFVHFSGFDPTRPNELSRYQNRHTTGTNPALADLLAEYASVREAAGGSSAGYGYAVLDSGEPIRPLWREAVRVRHPLLGDVGNPFSTAAHPKLAGRFRAIEARACNDPLLARLREPGPEKEQLDSLRQSIVFAPLLALYRRFGFIKWS